MRLLLICAAIILRAKLTFHSSWGFSQVQNLFCCVIRPTLLHHIVSFLFGVVAIFLFYLQWSPPKISFKNGNQFKMDTQINGLLFTKMVTDITLCTVNIFCCKKWSWFWRFFFILILQYYLMIFQSGECQMWCRSRKIIKSWRKWRKI